MQKTHPATSKVFKKKELDSEKAMAMLDSESYSPSNEDSIYLVIGTNINEFISDPTNFYYSWFKKNLKKSTSKKK
ncbi:MAG: hypothetical protein KC455_01865 [Carnobacterium sp.]|nr:hypothetical protein [Carnobacterium sp.]